MRITADDICTCYVYRQKHCSASTTMSTVDRTKWTALQNTCVQSASFCARFNNTISELEHEWKNLALCYQCASQASIGAMGYVWICLNFYSLAANDLVASSVNVLGVTYTIADSQHNDYQPSWLTWLSISTVQLEKNNCRILEDYPATQLNY